MNLDQRREKFIAEHPERSEEFGFSKCNVPLCDRKSHIRGLCGSHYTVTCKLVKLGETTEEELVAKGVYSPRHHAKRAYGLKFEVLEALGRATRHEV